MKIFKQLFFVLFLSIIGTTVLLAQAQATEGKNRQIEKKGKKEKQTIIKGKILNSASSTIELRLAYGDNPRQYGTATVNADGSFLMQTTVQEDDLYRLVLSKDHFLLLEIVPGDAIDLVVDANNLRTILSVAGSKAMGFVKDVVDYMSAGRQRIDSLASLQNTTVDFYNKFFLKFDQFRHSNLDVDRCLLAIFNYTDTLNDLMDRYTKNGAVESKKIDSFLLRVPKYLKSIENNYLPFENYLQNVGMYYNFKENRVSGKDEFYKILDIYLNLLDERHELASNTLDQYVSEIKPFVAMYDSLLYHDKLSKKKNKEAVCNAAVRIMAKYGQPVAIQKSTYLVKAQASVNVNNDLLAYVQQDAGRIMQAYQKASAAETEKQLGKLKEMLLANKEYLAVLMFIDNFPRESNEEMYKEIMEALVKKYPDNLLVQDRQNSMTKIASATSVGSIAPELEYENPEGKLIKLSSLRGKYVLIDFWASWCRPCRMENPTVVKLYQKYRDKGFEIYSLSLDKDRDSWLAAIKADNLIWDSHVSDLKYWSADGAKKYGVSSIPSTFLIDKEGRIIAKNLRGDALANALKEIFGE